jgi:hypothetical protein
LIRQRRSAVNFDGVSSISPETFLAILDMSAKLSPNSASRTKTANGNPTIGESP